MKSLTLRSLPLISFLLFEPQQVNGVSHTNLYPGDLVSMDTIRSFCPEIYSAEQQAIGTTLVCTYLNKKGLPVLMVSISDVGSVTASELLMPIGNNEYEIREIAQLGDNAAAAIQRAAPRFGFEEGLAQLMVKCDSLLLQFSPIRFNGESVDEELTAIILLAEHMLRQLCRNTGKNQIFCRKPEPEKKMPQTESWHYKKI